MKNFTCKVCNYSWWPRTPKPPATCPKCKRYNWKTGKGPVTKQAIEHQKKESCESK